MSELNHASEDIGLLVRVSTAPLLLISSLVNLQISVIWLSTKTMNEL